MPKVIVRYTEQQLVLLRGLLDEGTHGRTLEELTLSLLREYARQMLGREYQQP